MQQTNISHKREPMNLRTASNGKGRSADLIAERNNQLIARFYFYKYIISKINFEAIVNVLVTEFSISTHTIYRIITDHSQDVTKLRGDGTTTRQLKKDYPHFNWNEKDCIQNAFKQS